MRKILIIVILIVVSIVAYRIYREIPSDEKTSDFNVSSMLYDMRTAEPAFVNAYIDASGSMKGYFSIQSDGRFITALSNANPQKTMWMDGKYTELKGIPTNQLLTNNFKGGDSRFDTMLSYIINRDTLYKSNGVSLLFTDGILSASKSTTNTNPRFMLQSFNVLKNYIAKSIKGKDVAVAVLNLESKYIGTYWNYQNNPINDVIVENRPFYVIAVGKPERIRYFMTNNQLGAKLTAEFGIYDTKVENKEGTFAPLVPMDWDGSKLKGNKIEFCLTLPDYIADLGDAFVKKNIIIEFDGIDETERLNMCISVIGKNLRIENWVSNDVSKPILTPGEHTLTIKLKKTMQEEWRKLFCEDDEDIKVNNDKQKQTFALEYLLKGIQEGTEIDDVIIFSSTIKFSR